MGGEIGRGGGRFLRPLGDQVPKEHVEELEQGIEHEHQVEEAIKAQRAGKRRWHLFWRRDPRHLSHS
jgi:hypothetical protein